MQLEILKIVYIVKIINIYKIVKIFWIPSIKILIKKL